MELEVLELCCKHMQLKWTNLGISLLPKGLNILNTGIFLWAYRGDTHTCLTASSSPDLNAFWNHSLWFFKVCFLGLVLMNWI